MTEVPNPYLELRQGTRSLGQMEITPGGELVAGRTGQCPVIVDHSSVSRMHARIFRDSHGVYLEDLGSANGTFLNGQPVTKASALDDGAQIQLGQKTVADPVLLIYHDPASRLLREMGLLPAAIPAQAAPSPTHPTNLPRTTPTPRAEPRSQPRPADTATEFEEGEVVDDHGASQVIEVVPPRPASVSTARLLIVLGVLGLAIFAGLLFAATKFLKPASTLWSTVQVTPSQVAAGSLLTLQSPDIQPADDLVALFAGDEIEGVVVTPGRLEVRLPRLGDRGAGRYEIPLLVRRGDIDVFQTTLQYQVIPEIATLTERSTVGDIVEIEGSGFSERRGGVKVLFGETEGEVIESRLTSVKARVPVLTRAEEVAVALRVRVGAFEATAPGRLTVGPRAPNPVTMSFRAEPRGEGTWEVSHPIGRAFVLRRNTGASELQAELDRLALVFERAAREPSLRLELRPGSGRWALVARTDTRSQTETVISWSQDDLEATAAAAGSKTPPDMVAYWLASVANDFLEVFGRGKALNAKPDAPAYQRALDALIASALEAGGRGRPEVSDLEALDPVLRETIAQAFFAVPTGWGRVAGDWHIVLENLFTPEDGYETHVMVRLTQRDRSLSGEATLSFRGDSVEYGIPVANLSGRLEPGLPPRVRLEGQFNRPVGRLVLEGTLTPDGLVGEFTSSQVVGRGTFQGRLIR